MRTTFECGRTYGFPLRGLGLRSHARRRADHRCNRNYSTVVILSPMVGPVSGGLTNKTGGIKQRSKKDRYSISSSARTSSVGGISSRGAQRSCCP